MNNRVRAIIKKEGKVLLIHRIKEGREYWVFPGGGVEDGESLSDALRRECMEELGVIVEIGDVFTINEFTADNVISKEFFIKCEIVGGELGSGKGPEYVSDNGYKGTYNLEWISVKELLRFVVKPEEVKDMIFKEAQNENIGD